MNAKPPFEQVVRRHGLTVLRMCRALLDDSDADDAWSETFLAALAAYADLPDEANVQAWLVTIAHHKALDLVRARARHAQPTADPPDRPAVDGLPGSGPDADLVSALRRLPEKQRYAVAYHHLVGLSYAEVADVLGGSTAAARRAGSDGIAQLRNSLLVKGVRP